MKNKNALAVMLKTPIPGMVKTRLCPPLKQKEASELYKCFITDIFERVLGLIRIDIFAVYTPVGTERYLKGLIPENVNLMPQNGNDLGERLKNLFLDLFKKGCKNIAVIGSDSPDMPIEYIRTAFDKSKNGRIVFGPAVDGGYYLIAMNKFYKEIFEDIPWGTDKVLDESLKIAKKQGIKTSLLPEWHDIDRYDDLKKLVKNKKEIPNTYKFIKKKIL